MAKKRKETIEFSISLKFNVEYDDNKLSVEEIVDALEFDVLSSLAITDVKHVKNVHADMRPVGKKKGWFKSKRNKLCKLGKLGKTFDKLVAEGS